MRCLYAAGSSNWLRPSRRMSPVLGSSRPTIMLTVVLLPEPLGPRYPTTSPRLTVKLTLSTASRPSYRFDRQRTSSMSRQPGQEFNGDQPRGPVLGHEQRSERPCRGHQQVGEKRHEEANERDEPVLTSRMFPARGGDVREDEDRDGDQKERVDDRWTDAQRVEAARQRHQLQARPACREHRDDGGTDRERAQPVDPRDLEVGFRHG